jgi:hypothetical protein
MPVALCLCALLSARAFGQAGPTDVPQSPPAKLDGKFAVAYNAASDQTVVSLLHRPVGGERACGIYTTTAFLHYGKTAFPPKLIMLSFTRITTEEPTTLRQPADRELTLDVDGETLKLGPMTQMKMTVVGYSLYEQGLVLPLPFETFSKVASAKRVEVKLGPLAFRLTDANLSDLRDLLNRMKR